MIMIETGGEFDAFVRRQNLPDISEKRLIENTVRILERTELLTGGKSANCQLVVGEVQSGKTMSFTALIALAHENGFPLVIVLAGTKNQLLMQTKDRLNRDLRADGDGGANPWVVMDKLQKKARTENIQKVQKILNIWVESDAPKAFKPTVVISSLKNRESLDEIAHLVEGLKSRFSISNFPVLIVDDEGDQAGLNLKWRDDDESPVYAAISRLRNSLTKHSYVMYTATPQGPLLIGIQDALSPKFVTLLKSGDDYLGGRDLFEDSEYFVKYIPNQEHASLFDKSTSAPVPASLKQALAYYLLSLYVAQRRARPKPISMLVHPSSSIELHRAYERWVNNVLNAWESVLRDPLEQTYKNEKTRIFEVAEAELRKTIKLKSDWNLDEALQEIRWWISKIGVRVINSEGQKIKPDEWKSQAGWIVIGGNNLERGFTIENLAVTYMPRSLGGGNADVIQQRGRFFGYKRPYIDLLRGWFFQDNAQAYRDYVVHEKSIRSQLEVIDKKNGLLSEWRRRFLLDPAYSPVRREVIALQIMQKRLSVFKQHKLYDPSLHPLSESFLKRIYTSLSNLKEMENDLRKGSKNYYSNISINAALEFLVDWPMAPENRAELDDTIWALCALADENKLTRACIVLMDWDPKKATQAVRERSMLKDLPNPALLAEDQAIANIFQGRSPKSDGNYPGDAEMKFDDALTIQVHRVAPLLSGKKQPDVVALGLIMPDNTAGFVVELPARKNSK
jgi:hypothetical protein